MKIASVSETRQQLSSFLNLVKGRQEDVVIQNRGKAEAVLIPYADYELLQAARTKRRRQQALEELRQIALEINERNKDMSQEEVERLADEIADEVIENLVKKGKVTFQEYK